MAIDTNNPFGFSYSGTKSSTGNSNQWGMGQGDNQGNGATATNGELNVGTSNTADNFGDLVGDKTYDGQNGGSGNGNGGLWGDPTVVNTAVAFNATFVADNIYTHSGSIGLYGVSRGQPITIEVPHGFCIGVMGQSSSGCGLYGMVTQELIPHPPPEGPQSPNTGIGVVGRAMDGNPTESIPNPIPTPEFPVLPVSVEDIMAQQIGVLGHAFNGPGVRGHGGGPLLPTAFPPPAAFNPSAQPGGVFSSGQLAVEPIQGAGHFNQVVSRTSQSQLRLTPSTHPELPPFANVGDFFLRMPPFDSHFPPLTQVPAPPSAELWICVYQQLSETTGLPQAYWRRVLLGEYAFPGGTPL